MRCNMSLKSCSDSLTTSRGTYTFYESEMNKNDAAKFCEDKGQILAPITSQEEFDAMHNHVIKCGNLCGINVYHIGLYVFGKDVKLFSNCEKWDSAKHEKLFYWDMEDGPCYRTYYIPHENEMSVESTNACGATEMRPICFKAADKQTQNAETLRQSESSNSYSSISLLGSVIALVALVISLGVALFISVRKLKKLKQTLPVSTE